MGCRSPFTTDLYFIVILSLLVSFSNANSFQCRATIRRQLSDDFERASNKSPQIIWHTLDSHSFYALVLRPLLIHFQSECKWFVSIKYFLLCWFLSVINQVVLSKKQDLVDTLWKLTQYWKALNCDYFKGLIKCNNYKICISYTHIHFGHLVVVKWLASLAC